MNDTIRAASVFAGFAAMDENRPEFPRMIERQLEQAVIAEDQIGEGVPSFIAKWRATVDEDGQYCFAVAR